MTKEIAKKIFGELLLFGKASCKKEELEDLCKIVLTALEQESTTKNDLAVEKTDMIDKSNFSQEQYKADLQSAYDSGYEQAKNDLGVDSISRAQAQTKLEMNASRYTIARERGGMGQVEWSDQLIKVSDAVDIIRDLPSVTPQEPRWIPTSERLPEEIGTYLVTLEYKEHETGITTLWFGSLGWDLRAADVVTAWMPLPKAYSEVKE